MPSEMGSRESKVRSAGEEVYRLIAHAESLNREAAMALDSGEYKRGIALLEKAELLSHDVTYWVDELEGEEPDPLSGDSGSQGNTASSEPNAEFLFSGFRHLSLGLGAGLAVGCVVAEV